MFLSLHILFAICYVFVHQFTRNNNCSIEFDAFGFSIKDLQTRLEVLHCHSGGELYILPHSSPPAAACHVAAILLSLWHSRLGHPAPAAIDTLNKISAISCNNADRVVSHLSTWQTYTAALPTLQHLLNLFIVMFGHLQSLACLALNIIL
jgi:hypothetical protein